MSIPCLWEAGSKLAYVVSAKFDYHSYICPDVGPAYASALGIQVLSFSGVSYGEDYIYIIDPQLSGAEVAALRSVIFNHDTRIVFRIIDPYWPPQDTNPLRSLAFEAASLRESCVLSAYQPSEIVDLLAKVYGPKRFHVSPYPYDVSKEIPFDWSHRKRMIAITGNHNPSLYPVRALARRKRVTSPLWRAFTTNLSHPGYMNAFGGQALVGDRYIRYLSQHMMMYLCPSRARLEFLKYRECAYAGCCPVGQSPEGFPVSASDSILNVSLTAFKEQFRKIRHTTPEELLDRSTRYRLSLAQERSPSLIKDRLLKWVNSVYG